MKLKKCINKFFVLNLLVNIFTMDCNSNAEDNKMISNDILLQSLIGLYIITPNGKNEIVSVANNDGSIFLFGGKDQRNQTLSTTYKYLDKLENIGNLISPRQNHTVTRLDNGKILIIGGYDGESLLGTTEIFDLNENSFVKGPNLNIPRSHHASVKLNDGRVLVTGGWGGGNWTDEAEIYTASLNLFQKISRLKTPRGRHTANLISSGEVLISGGDSLDKVLDSVELFDPTTNQFSNTISMSEAKANHTATSLPGNKVVLVGGYNRNSSKILYQRSIEIYDRTLNSFTKVVELENGRHSHRVALIDSNTLLICGGASGSSNYSNECSTLNVTTNSINIYARMLESRAYFAMNYIGNKGTLICGGNNTLLIDNCELIDKEGKSSYLSEKLY